MPEGEPVWYRWADIPKEEVSERLSRRLITGDRVMLARVYLKKGCAVPKHAHENEQFTYILEGALRFLVGEDGVKRSSCERGRCCTFPPTCRTPPTRSRTRWTWTCSRRRGRTG